MSLESEPPGATVEIVSGVSLPGTKTSCTTPCELAVLPEASATFLFNHKDFEASHQRTAYKGLPYLAYLNLVILPIPFGAVVGFAIDYLNDNLFNLEPDRFVVIFSEDDERVQEDESAADQFSSDDTSGDDAANDHRPPPPESDFHASTPFPTGPSFEAVKQAYPEAQVKSLISQYYGTYTSQQRVQDTMARLYHILVEMEKKGLPLDFEQAVRIDHAERHRW